MKISLKASNSLSQPLDFLGLPVFQDKPEQVVGGFPAPFAATVRESIKKENFKGGKKEMLTVSGRGLVSPYKLVFAGLGRNADVTLDLLRERIAETFKIMSQSKAVVCGLVIPEELLKKFETNICIQAAVESINLSLYRFKKYKSSKNESEDREIEEVYLFLPPSRISSGAEGLESGLVTSRATMYARDLVNEPSQITTPSFLAAEAVRIAKNSKGSVKVEILEKIEAEKLGMNAFLGVSRGSDEPPKFIILRYKNDKPRRKITIIGKGITFDTGGLSLKPPNSMETMKLDMAGAASILGVFSEVHKLEPKADLTGIVAACENMPSGRALKPGDILRALNGKTIEVLNTDAEGRLTLADALSYTVAKIKPDEIIDLATLTGACMVALGEDIAGIFSNNGKLLENLKKAATIANEKIWSMPMPPEYKEMNKSHIADIKNIGQGRYAGAITAALFLEEFVDGVPWAHLDIAGPAFMERDTLMCPYGGAGFGVRLLLQYLSLL